ncbi:MAG TPA: nicotinate-nucleotide--dimethylbenzimidazole phosphoribosyltransferase [Lentisphaeria bacterium]|nr:MAG: nicotinate-nucleotide--dimethylbenzimidazole phosphoribosyltransferase [Lentisphaerae bacterium GWF2_50_93]HCE43631.1 nicotinate-nucleotide--dimethylbenzimidazole phosphoribosyltransferase [Lentisphaeria bacterium]
MLLEETLSKISPADANIAEQAQNRLNSLTKPLGSLGLLEDCARKYAAARGDVFAKIAKPAILTFAGDHGIADEGVSAFPREVTPQMVANFANGGAAINVLTRHGKIKLKVIDIGVAADCPFKGVIRKKVAPGTANFAKGPAMTIKQTKKAIEIGIKLAEKEIKRGCTLLGTGDMGIANTTPSAALYSVFLNLDPEKTAGKGTGITDEKLQHKIDVLRKAIEFHKPNLKDPLSTLAALGGYEIAGICGVVLAAAANKIPVVVDGFISGAGALTAIQMNQNVKDYCFFSHLSAEAGHVNAMNALGVRPILNLDLRLGEGTGAALSMHLIEAGVKIMHEMATFESAGVSNSK